MSGMQSRKHTGECPSKVMRIQTLKVSIFGVLQRGNPTKRKRATKPVQVRFAVVVSTVRGLSECGSIVRLHETKDKHEKHTPNSTRTPSSPTDSDRNVRANAARTLFRLTLSEVPDAPLIVFCYLAASERTMLHALSLSGLRCLLLTVPRLLARKGCASSERNSGKKQNQ